jgi:hypothetical protein
MVPSIVDARARSRPELKARETFLHFDSVRPQLTFDRYDTFGIKRLLYPPDSPDLTPCDFGYSDILSIVLRDGSSMMTSHWEERCWKF